MDKSCWILKNCLLNFLVLKLPELLSLHLLLEAVIRPQDVNVGQVGVVPEGNDGITGVPDQEDGAAFEPRRQPVQPPGQGFLGTRPA